MNIIEIACSTMGTDDGIGKHARIITEELSNRAEVDSAVLFSGNTVGFSKVQYVFSLEMMKAFFRATNYVKSNNIDCVIVEYPFREYNPLVLFSFQILKYFCHRNNCKICLSMHEYDRVTPLRKLMVKFFIIYSDFVFVSEEKYLTKLKRFNDCLYLRTIPNHVEIVERKKSSSSKKEFVYFGLINKAKAFEEMISAWDKFNSDNEYHLSIVTATQIEFDADLHKNIDLYIGLDDKESSRVMWESQFSIVPVLPSIGLNNSTFISTIQCGCIPIGKFGEDLSKLDFAIDMDAYELDNFLASLKYATKLDDKQLKDKSSKAFEFGKKFSINSTVDMMLEAIKKETKYDI